MQSSTNSTAGSFFGLLDRALRVLDSKWFVWLLLAFGAALRIREYLLNNALYEDEAALALNIFNKSVGELFGRLDSNQVAPVGFLLLEKLSVVLFGTTEYALRLPPLLLSLAALLLFWELARRFVRGASLLLALGLFSASVYVTHYSSQVKQYSGDVAIGLGLALMGLRTATQSMTLKRTAWFAFAGAAAIWFSHPSVFVLAGVGSWLIIAAIARRDWQRMVRLSIACGFWLVSFVTSYLISLRGASQNSGLERSWEDKGTFMPLPPRSLSDLKWFPDALIRFFENPMGSPFPLVAVCVLIVGLIAVYRTHRAQLLVLILPVVFALLASGIHKYPFGKRLVLFLVPTAILVMASGFELLLTNRVSLRLLGVALSLLLVLKPMASASSHARWGPTNPDIRHIISYVKDHRQSGDFTYFYHGQRDAFRYYAPRLGFEEQEYAIGNDPPEKVPKRLATTVTFDTDKSDLDQLRGKSRVWIVFSGARIYQGVNEEQFMCEYLDTFALRIEQYKRSGIAAYLYDASGANAEVINESR
jgi:hypothetical protein